MGMLSRSEEIPPEMHCAFAYEMLQQVSCSLALGPELRNAERSLSQSPRSPGSVARAPFLSISVTDPVKMGTSIQSYISYRVIPRSSASFYVPSPGSVGYLDLVQIQWFLVWFYDVETLAGVARSLVPLVTANATLQANGPTRMLAAASAALQADNTVRAVAQCPPWNITAAECTLCLYNSVQDFVTPVKYKAKCEDMKRINKE
ncbi:putative PX protein [Hordeum vulgare]|nr:putative PX protein [Hordeum vulgare]